MSLRIALHHAAYSQGTTKLVNNASCTLTTGITYVVGRNGAGKSSLLKLIATAAKPDQGSISYSQLIRDEAGMYRKQLSIEDVRTMIGYMPQHFTGHPDMSIERYLTYIAYHKGIPYRLVKPMIEKWLQESGLHELRRRKLRSLSGGQLQGVGLIQALLNQPRICILDEPFEGLDNHEKSFFRHILNRLAFHSVILMSTHLLEEIEQSDNNSLLYIEEGTVRYCGGVDEVERILERFRD